MYSTCLFCHRPLGANHSLEIFPVGQRLAFDVAKGRLWVVCRACERWNLTPVDERWEATEACERLFRGTRLRASTQNVGLARVAGGLDLVRIGEPLRPELAAWRYGDQFGRRRRRMLLTTGAGLAVVGGVAGGLALSGMVLGGWWGLAQLAYAMVKGRPGEVLALARPEQHRELVVTRERLAGARLVWERDREDWALEMYFGGLVTLRGEEARRVVTRLLPAVNRFGGSARRTQDAVALLEQHGEAEGLFRAVASEWDGSRSGYRRLPDGKLEFVPEAPHGFLARLPAVKRLALEMAANEDVERRAMEGELALLEHAWREAEEIAAIADGLLVPADVTKFLETNRP